LSGNAARRTAAAGAAVLPLAPMALDRPAVAGRSVLKVAVFNVAGGADLDAIRRCFMLPPLADAGTLLLCEASWRVPRHAMVEFAPSLAAALRMSFVFVPSFGRVGASGAVRALGNAILCAQPIEDFRAIPLTRPPFRFYRHPLIGAHQGILASVRTGVGRVTMGVVHLERRWDPAGRARQMEDFLRAIGDEARVIIGGDFNTSTLDMDRRWSLLRAAAKIVASPRRFREPQPYEPLFDRMNEHGLSIKGANVAHAPTFTLSRAVPMRWRPKLDWIAARGVAPKEGSAAVVAARTSVLGRRVSDHDFVLCEFGL